MTNDIPSMLITWRDVEARIRSGGPSTAWRAQEVDLFGVRLYTDKPEEAREELSARVGSAFDPDDLTINLLPGGAPRLLPVEILGAADAPPPPVEVARPLWSSVRLETRPELQTGQHTIAAFFSFKGGVGRTTSCFATLLRLLDRKQPARVLYVDADVEAPGLTWQVPSQERLSWVDALALLHDSNDWRSESLPLIAQQVQLSRAALELSKGRREFFFMPAVRDLAQVERLPATPEQLVRRRGRSWIIGDFLEALATKLELDAVLVDLRAGLTEFSSPVMLDPRVRNVLVTSCSDQSVRGTIRAMEQVEARTSWSADLQVVVTMVPRDGDDVFNSVNRDIDRAWADSGDDVEADPPVVHPVSFSDALLVFDSLDGMAARMPGTSLWEVAEVLSEGISAPRTPRPVAPAPTGDTRERIASLAGQLEFAEQNAQLGLLPTPPLKELVRQAPGQLPASVVLGSKGAGKTFTWAQMIIAGAVGEFRRAVGVSGDNSEDAHIFPLLSPAQLGDPLRERAHEVEAYFRPPSASRQTSSELARSITGLSDPTDGLGFWTKAVADRLGLPPEAAASVRALQKAIAATGKRVVLLVDGLEDALQVGPSAPMTEAQRKVLRGLLVDFINELRDLGPRHLGLVAFVRRDLARSAIPQNFGQFESRHKQVALRWSPADALRLTLWLLDRAGWSLLETNKVTTAPREVLAEKLYPFWSEKLGGGQKEAYSDRWVVAALSDLNGRFQARDLVRLVHYATTHADSFPISRAALQKAIEQCSAKKVEELEQEVTQLRPVFRKLRELPSDKRTIPISVADLSVLDEEQTSFLVDEGLLFLDEDESQYYMPEIVRYGLDFGLARRGRARVLSLQRAAQRRR